MRKLTLSLLISFIMLVWTSKGYAQNNYQEDIKSAYREALLTKEGTTSLKKTHQHLEQLLVKEHTNELSYWLAYNEYYMAKHFELRGKKNYAEDLLDQGIKRLEALKEKSAEDYSLLSFLQYNYMKYTSLGRIPLAKKMASNCQKALELEPKNLRANVVWGIIDLARPRAFGGGKEGEMFLLDAIENLSEQTVVSQILPTWGKEEAYEALIRHYIKVKRKEETHIFV